MGNLFKLFTTLLLIIFFFNPQKNSAQRFSSEHIELSDKIHSLVNTYYNANEFSGSVLVADQGNILINKEYGYLNIDKTKEIDKTSVFEIASISKQFTALLIMILQEDNKLNYDDKIIKYFPYITYKNITIRHLLTHTSGLSEKLFFKWAGKNMAPDKIYTNEFILKYLENERPDLAFEPGEKWEYSNLGYLLLPLIMKKITGEHYITYLNKKILEPLEMNNSGIFSQSTKGTKMNNYAFGKIFNSKDSTFISGFGFAKSDSIYGSVGILSNTTDLFKYDRALYTNKLVNHETLEEAFTPYTLADATSSKYGFGWFITDDFTINGVNCGKRINHHGLWPGYESSFIRFIDKDKTIIILSNQAPSSKDKLVEEISKLLFNKNI